MAVRSWLGYRAPYQFLRQHLSATWPWFPSGAGSPTIVVPVMSSGDPSLPAKPCDLGLEMPVSEEQPSQD